MGVNLAFNSSADFSNIRSQNDLKLDEIIHKVYLNINEGGADAFSINAFQLTNSTPQLEKSYNMVVNKPFLFMLINPILPKNYDIIFISKIEYIY